VTGVIGIYLAGFGFINPIVAAAIHGASDILFILNSSRLMLGARKETTSH
jgi:Cd2+/Zn2+-exporting ATPase/Cu+-exporting ATPase